MLRSRETSVARTPCTPGITHTRCTCATGSVFLHWKLKGQPAIDTRVWRKLCSVTYPPSWLIKGRGVVWWMLLLWAGATGKANFIPNIYLLNFLIWLTSEMAAMGTGGEDEVKCFSKTSPIKSTVTSFDHHFHCAADNYNHNPFLIMTHPRKRKWRCKKWKWPKTQDKLNNTQLIIHTHTQTHTHTHANDTRTNTHKHNLQKELY